VTFATALHEPPLSGDLGEVWLSVRDSVQFEGGIATKNETVELGCWLSESRNVVEGCAALAKHGLGFEAGEKLHHLNCREWP
jgi:hypothetical protein